MSASEIGRRVAFAAPPPLEQCACTGAPASPSPGRMSPGPLAGTPGNLPHPGKDPSGAVSCQGLPVSQQLGYPGFTRDGHVSTSVFHVAQQPHHLASLVIWTMGRRSCLIPEINPQQEPGGASGCVPVCRKTSESTRTYGVRLPVVTRTDRPKR
jgi:hypothetical protein